MDCSPNCKNIDICRAPAGALQISLRISISQSDFVDGPLDHGTLRTGSFYHELVIGSLDNGDDSVVVSNGTFTVDPSIFTEKGGR